MFKNKVKVRVKLGFGVVGGFFSWFFSGFFSVGFLGGRCVEIGKEDLKLAILCVINKSISSIYTVHFLFITDILIIFNSNFARNLLKTNKITT